LAELLSKFGREKEAGWAREQADAYDVHLSEHGSFL
jgi:hypothetical protein